MSMAANANEGISRVNYVFSLGFVGCVIALLCTSANAQTYVNIRTNADGVWASGYNTPELGNSLTDGNHTIPAITNITGQYYDLTASPIFLATETTISYAAGVVGHVTDNWEMVDNVAVNVWSSSGAFASSPLVGDVYTTMSVTANLVDAPLFGGTGGTQGEALRYGTFEFADFTLPPGSYLIGLKDDNGAAFTFGQSEVEQTGGILGMDWYAHESFGVSPYSAFGIEYGGTAALDLFALVESLNGDYNGDGSVDAADYTVWRDNYGATSGPGLAADGNGDMQVNGADYLLWQQHFGESVSSSAANPTLTVPEPSAGLMALFALLGWARVRR